MFRTPWAPARAHPAPATSRRRAAGRAAAGIAVLIAVLAVPSAAAADAAVPVTVAVNSLPQVVSNLQAWLLGVLTAVATLFLILAGVLWATAGSDPGQVERAKGALRNALVGYAAAVLAPVLLQVVKGIVGG